MILTDRNSALATLLITQGPERDVSPYLPSVQGEACPSSVQSPPLISLVPRVKGVSHLPSVQGEMCPPLPRVQGEACPSSSWYPGRSVSLISLMSRDKRVPHLPSIQGEVCPLSCLIPVAYSQPHACPSRIQPFLTPWKLWLCSPFL